MIVPGAVATAATVMASAVAAELKAVPARALVAVDEFAPQISGNSGQFACRTGFPEP